MPSEPRTLLPLLFLVVAILAACSGGGSGGSAPSPSFTLGFGADGVIRVVTDGQTFVATLTASHPTDGEPLTFAIDGGDDSGAFSLDTGTGILSFTIAPAFATPTDANADNVYEVTVSVADSAGRRDTLTFSVAVAFAVDTLDDVVDGDLTAGNRSLREVLDFVLPGEAVSFDPALSGGTITLALGQILLDQGVTIDGDVNNDGNADITIDAGGLSRIFEIDDLSGTPDLDVEIQGLALLNGSVAAPGGAIRNVENLRLVDVEIDDSATTGSDDEGGAIANFDGELTVEGCQIVGNATAGADGGGIFNDGGELTVVSSEIVFNDAGLSGGGLASTSGALEVRHSLFEGNTAASRGGGLYTQQESYTIDASTFTLNDADDGGAIFSVTNNPTQSGLIVNSTIDSNTASDDGGGLHILFNRVDIDNTTITDNVAGGTGGGIHASEFDPDFGSRTRLGSTIVSQNMPTDLHHETVFTGQDPIFSRGGNFVGIGNATTRFSASEVFGVTDPLLDALAFNGGETRTRLPQAASPVIDAGRNTRGLATDQRGEARTFGPRTDVGAVERNDAD